MSHYLFYFFFYILAWILLKEYYLLLFVLLNWKQKWKCGDDEAFAYAQRHCFKKILYLENHAGLQVPLARVSLYLCSLTGGIIGNVNTAWKYLQKNKKQSLTNGYRPINLQLITGLKSSKRSMRRKEWLLSETEKWFGFCKKIDNIFVGVRKVLCSSSLLKMTYTFLKLFWENYMQIMRCCIKTPCLYPII